MTATEVFVEAPARLHFGVLDLRGELGRWFGGIGAAAPEATLLVSASKALTVTAHGQDAQRAAGFAKRFLEHHHINDKTDCHTCWARPLCAGGCYHEAHVRYGTTRRPNLHYCEWIRGWTDTCLQVYGELSVRNPEFLARFDRDEAKAEAVL